LSVWAILALLTMALAAPAAMAQTEDPPADPGVTEEAAPAETPEDEAPAFANPTQAAKAAALAEAAAEAAAEANAEALAEAEQAVADAQAAVDTAAAALAAAQEAEDAEAEAQAQADLDAAMSDLEAAQASADQAVSDAASISVDDIASMRADGMGWGEIAQELGVHPSTVGLGHRHQNRTRAEVASRGVGKEKASVAAKAGKATSRNTKAGVSRTPGVSGGKGAKSVGLSRASEKAQTGAKGSKSSNDNSSSGRGNSGNSNAGGKGKSQGKGGSNAGGNGKGNGKSK
jgi:hypothetical protein